MRRNVIFIYRENIAVCNNIEYIYIFQMSSVSSSKSPGGETNNDILFLREIMVSAPYTYPKGSKERGQVWMKIADGLRQPVVI